jgi:hypothetical protein
VNTISAHESNNQAFVENDWKNLRRHGFSQCVLECIFPSPHVLSAGECIVRENFYIFNFQYFPFSEVDNKGYKVPCMLMKMKFMTHLCQMP